MSLKANLQVTPQELFTTSSTQMTDVGAFATTGDSRGFRYCLAGATTLATGKLQQASAEDTSNLENLAIAASGTGAFTVTTTSTVTLTANQATGGFLIVTVTPGVGFLYKIKSHPAATAAVVTFTLEDALVQNLTTSSKIDVILNPYASIVVNPTTATSGPVGVAVYPVTNAQWGWVQTKGPTSVLAQGTVSVGLTVTASAVTAGAVAASIGSQPVVGYALTGIAATEYGAVYLTID